MSYDLDYGPHRGAHGDPRNEELPEWDYLDNRDKREELKSFSMQDLIDAATLVGDPEGLDREQLCDLIMEHE